MTLTTLKEEARAELKEYIRDYPARKFDLEYWIDKTYHATKEEDKKIIESMRDKCKHTDNLCQCVGFYVALDTLLSALEDTTTSPNS